ncbi:Methylmalonyl-CoA carboxyltransferase 1.3S subunit [compost metagenome]
MKPNQEAIINISEGKTIIVKFLYKSEADLNGIRTVYFKLNGQTKAIEIKDESIVSHVIQNRKASTVKEIGAPLPGLLSKICVKVGEEVKENQPLFTIEAMKMENTVLAHGFGLVNKIHLKENNMVEKGDLLIEYK